MQPPPQGDISHAYDSANQLIRENNQGANKTWTWEYDSIGNILCKKEYAYTTGALGTPIDTIEYGYDLMEWGQLLSSYDGNGVGYGYEGDVSNSVVYDDRYEYTWEHGHQLQRLHQMTVEDNFREHTFAYDANGMRTTRQIWDDYGSELTGSYAYTYNGSLLTQMTYSGTDGRYTMDFRYDANGTPLSVHLTHYVYEFEGVYYGEENPFTCCNATFYYITNLQGDVVAIVDYFGCLAATYTYDAWGRPLSTQAYECIGDFNPLRYRGYVCDTETGFYYLQSRYYDPVKGRFISPDGQISGVGGELLGNNQFAYCFNNPVNMSDSSGNWPKWLENTVKVVSVVVAVTAVVATVAAVSAFTAGTGSAAAVYGATILLGAALSGINGGVANEAKGNSYSNGYLGGATGGAIQAACSKTPVGTIVGGGAGVTVGTAVTDVMNNLDPDSANSTAKEIASNAITSGGKALVTSSLTAYMGYASDLAAINGANGLMPSYTRGFGEAVKAFFGWLDDALVYIWE